MGVWYQIQLDLDSNDVPEQDIPSCESYNVMRTSRPDEYVIKTKFEIYPQNSGPKPIKYESISTNHLTTIDDEVPAKMNYTPTSSKSLKIKFNFCNLSSKLW